VKTVHGKGQEKYPCHIYIPTEYQLPDLAIHSAFTSTNSETVISNSLHVAGPYKS